MSISILMLATRLLSQLVPQKFFYHPKTVSPVFFNYLKQVR